MFIEINRGNCAVRYNKMMVRTYVYIYGVAIDWFPAGTLDWPGSTYSRYNKMWYAVYSIYASYYWYLFLRLNLLSVVELSNAATSERHGGSVNTVQHEKYVHDEVENWLGNVGGVYLWDIGPGRKFWWTVLKVKRGKASLCDKK